MFTNLVDFKCAFRAIIPTMLLVVRKFTAPLALLLVVFFFAGVTCSPTVWASEVKQDQCCNSDAAPEVPAEKGECFDCNCPSCLIILHMPDYPGDTLSSAPQIYGVFFAEFPPGYIGSIDYPPEVV